MYLPPHFAETRPEELHRIIREHPLGVLVTHSGSGLDANHIPFEFDPDKGSQGTLSRISPEPIRCGRIFLRAQR